MAASSESVQENGRRSRAKYDRILSAALDVFARKGFHEAKVTEIARAAGVADGTIYLYFKNKDDLLISLFEAHLEQINTGLRKELEDVTEPPAQVERFIHYHLRLAQENPTLAALITVETRRSAKFIKEYAKGKLTEYLDQLAAIYERGKATGDFRAELTSGVFKHIVFGALDHTCQVWVTNPKRARDDLNEVRDQLTGMVLRGISARS